MLSEEKTSVKALRATNAVTALVTTEVVRKLLTKGARAAAPVRQATPPANQTASSGWSKPVLPPTPLGRGEPAGKETRVLVKSLSVKVTKVKAPERG